MSYNRSNLRIASQCPFIKVYISQLCLAWFFKGVTKFSDEVVAFKIGLTVSVIFKRWIFLLKIHKYWKGYFHLPHSRNGSLTIFCLFVWGVKIQTFLWNKKVLREMKLGPAPLLNIHDNSKNGYFHHSELSIFWSAYLN